MKPKLFLFIKNNKSLLALTACLCFSINNIQAQVPDPNQGLRADWMRGALGILWLPESNYNGNIEGVTIDAFLTQIKDLRAIDFVQVGLTSPSIYSPVHTGPNDIIESLWQGDIDTNGNPINLVVPRASAADPFLSWIKAIKAAGLRTEVYVNSYNLLNRFPTPPAAYPDLSQRWKDYCDTNPTVQAFIKSQPYHTGIWNATTNKYDDTEAQYPNRKYMFCYAEFILKEYAIRYGNLVSAWCFDSADNIMGGECGDKSHSALLEEQKIYQAFADAVHVGNPNAAVAFNNSTGDRVLNPFSTATYFDDYTFGHPFGGAGDMVENETLYTYNYHVIEWMQDYAGYAFLDDDRAWNDKVVSHFFPKQSTTSWNSGNTPCLTDAQFVEWNNNGLINGGAITWGTPLNITNLNNANPNLTLKSYALDQLSLVDESLQLKQSPGKPNWSRQYTILPNAIKGQSYSFTLVENFDFWDPEAVGVTDVSIITTDPYPTWLTVSKTATGEWTFSGTPTDLVAKEYTFRIRATDAADGGTNRWVTLSVSPTTPIVPIETAVQIQATANTNYGINKTATMLSGIQTAEDGKATFQISIDVIPPTGKAVISGSSSGSSTTKSWGLGDGTNANSDDIFTGSDNEWTNSIGNSKIVNFSANGSSLKASDISVSFESVTIVNAQSTNDNVAFIINGATINSGKTTNGLEAIALESLTAGLSLNTFSIGTGNTATDNKWSVEGFSMKVVYSSPTLATNAVSKTDESFIVYPNPVSDIVYFNAKPKRIMFYDINGKLVKTDESGNSFVNISNFQEGIYFMTFLNEDGRIINKKLLKK